MDLQKEIVSHQPMLRQSIGRKSQEIIYRVSQKNGILIINQKLKWSSVVAGLLFVRKSMKKDLATNCCL